jgi:UDP-N-acetylmuramoyl-L-alanyl-D-glutamate--2,6-diaminopimelate ligase
LGKKTAIAGTLGMGFPDALELTANTTPDAVSLHRRMAGFLQGGAQCVAMEVSSHGIVQERINGLVFAIALFTNLSRDHLDYHDSMEAYANAKARLFRWPGLKYAVLNLDDAFGVELLRQLEDRDIQVIGYGFTEPALRIQDSEKLRIVRGGSLKVDPQGLEFDIEFESEHSSFKTDVVGRFNASNLLGVMAALLASGIKLPDALRVLQQLPPVAGRMQQMGGGDQPFVVVDYAHTPDALEKVLGTLREIFSVGPKANAVSKIQNPRLICVFGCGGERDHGKRSLMGAVATRLADEVIITSDNPRKEDPRAIIDEITAGADANYHIEEDRAAAIYRAIQGAHKGDVVLIAGKGHETYQEVAGEQLPFDDCVVAQRALQSLMDRVSIQI